MTDYLWNINSPSKLNLTMTICYDNIKFNWNYIFQVPVNIFDNIILFLLLQIIGLTCIYLPKIEQMNW